MSEQKITDVPYIGEQTAKKLRKKLRGNRPTSRAGEPVSVDDATRFGTRAKTVLDTRQQRKLAEAADTFGFKLSREARQQQAARDQAKNTSSDRERIRRGDFVVSRDEFADARGRFEELPDEDRREDRDGREPVTTNYDQWSNNIDEFDYPGVDTPQQRRVRQQTADNLFTPVGAKARAREAWRESKPEQTDAQERLGETPPGFDAERTGVLRDASDGEFVERPMKKTDGGLVSANGRRVGTTFRDPTIGRDPDDGEFVDRPLDSEPTISAPSFVGGGTRSASSRGVVTFGTRATETASGFDPFDLGSGLLDDQGGADDITFGEQFDQTVTVGVTPDTLGDGFKIETANDSANRTLGKGTAVVGQAEEEVGLPDASGLDSTDVVAEAEVGLRDRDSGFGYEAEVIETRETDDNIFSFR